MTDDRIPIVGNDGKVHHVQDRQIAKRNTDALDSQVTDLETSKATASELQNYINDLSQLKARVLSVEALMSDLQTSYAVRQNQVVTSGVPDASGVYDQNIMQNTVNLVNDLKLTVNLMNL